ncbi:MAG: hypothetical protein R3F53_27050 [Gammaproteobacteria bacterium]
MLPLREREHDVLLAEYFLARYASEGGRPAMRLSTEVRQVMLDYAWPGNVRKLQNIIRQTVVLTDMLPAAIRESEASSGPAECEFINDLPQAPGLGKHTGLCMYAGTFTGCACG